MNMLSRRNKIFHSCYRGCLGTSSIHNESLVFLSEGGQSIQGSSSGQLAIIHNGPHMKARDSAHLGKLKPTFNCDKNTFKYNRLEAKGNQSTLYFVSEMEHTTETIKPEEHSQMWQVSSNQSQNMRDRQSQDSGTVIWNIGYDQLNQYERVVMNINPKSNNLYIFYVQSPL